jgi:hypothetical protein
MIIARAKISQENILEVLTDYFKNGDIDEVCVIIENAFGVECFFDPDDDHFEVIPKPYDYCGAFDQYGLDFDWKSFHPPSNRKLKGSDNEPL